MINKVNDTMQILINGLSSCIVTDNENPIFSLRLTKGNLNVAQASFTVVAKCGKLMWTTTPNPIENMEIVYSGEKLSPKTAYEVEACAFDKNGDVVVAKAQFETGFLNSPWQADWIEPVQNATQPEEQIPFHMIFAPQPDETAVFKRMQPAKELLKTFNCEVLPKKAVVYASAHGVYNLQINGKNVSDALLCPETSVYQKHIYYQTYNIASLLQKGENKLTVLLADGWWAGRIGLSGDSAQYGDKLGFIMQMELTNSEGHTSVICSDESFLCRTSYIDYADLFVGECHNYAKQLTGFEPCTIASYDKKVLVAQPIAPIKIWETYEPSYHVSPKGELIADFGQVLAGVAEIGFKTNENVTVTLDFCEVLDSEGNFHKNIIGRNKNQQDTIKANAGEHLFNPMFTYHGFRYVRISGIGKEQITSLVAKAMGTQLQKIGEFSCSDERINQLQHNILHSTRSNMVSVPTDCPQREKVGWTGDIQVFANTACFNYNMQNFLNGFLQHVEDEQCENGEVLCCAPCFPAQDLMERNKSGYNSSPAWGDACILVPISLYKMYGNENVLTKNYATMVKWLEFVKSIASLKGEDYDNMTPEQKERNEYLWTKGHQFGDWLIPSLRDKGHEGVQAGVNATYRVIGSCFYAITVSAFLEVLKVLVKKDNSLYSQIKHYEALLGKIKQAVQDEFVDENGYIEGNLQGLYVVMLYAEIGSEELRQKIAKNLAELICQNGKRLDTGFVSVPYLLDVLTANGYTSLAVDLMWQTQCPSWLYQVEQGATSIWENWAAIRPDGSVTDSSYNHYALGCVGDWLYRRIGGIAPELAGYKAVRFAPIFAAPLWWAKAKINTPYGVVSSSWQKHEDKIEYTINIPKTTKGILELPIAYKNWAEENSLEIVKLTKTSIEIKVENETSNFELPIL